MRATDVFFDYICMRSAVDVNFANAVQCEELEGVVDEGPVAQGEQTLRAP